MEVGVLDSGVAPTGVPIEASLSLITGDDSVEDYLGHAASCLRALDAALAMQGINPSSVRPFCAKA